MKFVGVAANVMAILQWKLSRRSMSSDATVLIRGRAELWASKWKENRRVSISAFRPIMPRFASDEAVLIET